MHVLTFILALSKRDAVHRLCCLWPFKKTGFDSCFQAASSFCLLALTACWSEIRSSFVPADQDGW